MVTTSAISAGGQIMVDMLRTLEQKEVVLVNLNIGRPYTAQIRGKEYYFEPLKRWLVAVKDADDILLCAQQDAINAAMQNAAEINDYQRMMGSQNAGMQMKARRFVDAQGEPKTKRWQYNPVIRLDNKEHKELFEKICQEATTAGISVPDIDRKEYIAKDETLSAPVREWNKIKLGKYIEDLGGTYSTVEDELKLYEKALKLYTATKKRLEALGIKVD
jgi:hypothetical protein